MSEYGDDDDDEMTSLSDVSTNGLNQNHGSSTSPKRVKKSPLKCPGAPKKTQRMDWHNEYCPDCDEIFYKCECK